MFISESDNGLAYNALAFQQAIVQPTNVISLINQQENLLVFTEKNIETWYDAGSYPFPFARYDGATIERARAVLTAPGGTVIGAAAVISFHGLVATVDNIGRLSGHFFNSRWLYP